MEKKYFTCNVHGHIGCHDVSKDLAEVSLAISQEEHPDEEWEMFEQKMIKDYR